MGDLVSNLHEDKEGKEQLQHHTIDLILFSKILRFK